jgi:hypothetical protein
MEETGNFLVGLQAAHDRRSKMPVYSSIAGLPVNEAHHHVSQMLRHPFQVIDGRTVNTVREVHRAVRRLYIRKTWRIGALFTGLDWTTMVDWLVEHWDDILRVILVVLPFLI